MKYDNLKQYTDSLNIAFRGINESYEIIGEMLYEISQDKLYKPDYKNFTIYVKEEFFLTRTKAYTFIKIYNLLKNHVEFKECSYSVLQEISSMKEEDLSELSADMTVADIRNLKKELRGEKKPKSKKQDEKLSIILEENEKLKKENDELKESLKKITF